MSGGRELTLRFNAGEVPPAPPESGMKAGRKLTLRFNAGEVPPAPPESGMKAGRELTLVLSERRLDAESAPRFHEVLRRNIAGATSLVVDMAAVVYISSAGLRALLSAQHAMEEAQGPLPGGGSRVTLRNVSEEVMSTLEVTGFSEIFNVEPAAGHTHGVQTGGAR